MDSYTQWYNENEGRSYPVGDSSSGLDNNNVPFPTDLIVDLSILVPPEHEDAFLSSVRLTATSVTVGISSPTSGLLLGTFLLNRVTPHVAYPLTNVIDNVSGWISFGTRSTLVVEDYRFASPDQSRLETRCVRVVDALPVEKFVRLGGSSTQTANQLVNVLSAAGVFVESDPLDEAKVIFRMDPRLKVAFAGPCNEVATRDICGTAPFRSINGVCPDENGKLTIRFE